MAANLSYNPESLVSLFFKLFLQKVFLINYYIDFFSRNVFSSDLNVTDDMLSLKSCVFSLFS